MSKQFSSKEKQFRVNDEIKFHSKVRIIGDGIESRIVSLNEAKDIANTMGLDLVEINTKTETPILKICEFSKFLYELKKAAKKQKNNVTQVKEIQLSVNIAQHDLETKAKQATNFIKHGDKVKVTLMMRGRELQRRDANKKSMLSFIELMQDVAVVESMKDEGNKTIVILKKNK